MGFDAVIFDMDGLLLDTERVSLRANQIACAELGFEIELDCFRALAGKDHQAVAEILSDWTETKIERDEYHHRWLAAYDTLTAARVDLRPTVVEALDMVTNLGLAKAIATTTGKEHAIEKLGKAGLAGRFQTIIGFYCVERRKPAPDPYLAAANALGVEPAKCLAFEDSDTGVRAALAAGMTVVQVPDIAPATEDRAHLRADDLLSGVQTGLELAF